MMLDSKASKTEDRFYAILPHTKYKDKINQVAHWELNTLLSVKLKLFEIMDTKDKLTLLFLGQIYGQTILPTFATPTIPSDRMKQHILEYPLNFDLTKPTITLHVHAHHSRLFYYIQLIPQKYSVLPKHYRELILRPVIDDLKESVGNQFQLDNHNLVFDMVRLSYFDENALESPAEMESSHLFTMCLIGSFVENKWFVSIGYPTIKIEEWDHHDNDDHGIVFNLY
ncbi:unnamed protein product [Absidia cylindrospora]